MYKFALLLLLIPVICAADVVTIDRVIVDNDADANGGDILGIPRQHIVATEGGGFVVYNAGYSTKRHIFYYDAWNSAADTVSGYFGQPTNYDGHAHMSIDFRSTADSDIVYLCYPAQAGGDSVLVTAFGIDEVDGEIHDLRESSSMAIVDANYTIYRGAAWPLIGTDSLLMITRGHDGSNNDAYDILWFASANNATSWSDSARLVDLSGATDNTRIGLTNRLKASGGLQTVSACIFTNDNNAIEWWDYNRTSHTWSKTSNDPISPVTQRMYAFAVKDDTLAFVAVVNDDATTRDSIFWAYKSINQTTWTEGAYETNQYSVVTDPELALSVTGTGRVVMFYTDLFYAHTDSACIKAVWFDFDTDTWQDETLVNDTTACRTMHTNISSCMYSPSAHGDAAYIVWLETVNSDDLVVGRISFADEVSTKKVRVRK